jgi:anti-sigma B factor antagonist
MEIFQSISEGVTIVTLIGRLDTNSTSEFEEDRRTWMAGPIIIDMSGLDYISSSGLRLFLQLKRDCAKKNTSIVFAGSRGSVEKIIRMSGFENIFPQYLSVEDALQAVAAGCA